MSTPSIPNKPILTHESLFTLSGPPRGNSKGISVFIFTLNRIEDHLRDVDEPVLYWNGKVTVHRNLTCKLQWSHSLQQAKDFKSLYAAQVMRTVMLGKRKCRIVEVDVHSLRVYDTEPDNY